MEEPTDDTPDQQAERERRNLVLLLAHLAAEEYREAGRLREEHDYEASPAPFEYRRRAALYGATAYVFDPEGPEVDPPGLPPGRYRKVGEDPPGLPPMWRNEEAVKRARQVLADVGPWLLYRKAKRRLIRRLCDTLEIGRYEAEDMLFLLAPTAVYMLPEELDPHALVGPARWTWRVGDALAPQLRDAAGLPPRERNKKPRESRLNQIAREERRESGLETEEQAKARRPRQPKHVSWAALKEVEEEGAFPTLTDQLSQESASKATVAELAARLDPDERRVLDASLDVIRGPGQLSLSAVLRLLSEEDDSWTDYGVRKAWRRICEAAGAA